MGLLDLLQGLTAAAGPEPDPGNRFRMPPDVLSTPRGTAGERLDLEQARGSPQAMAQENRRVAQRAELDKSFLPAAWRPVGDPRQRTQEGIPDALRAPPPAMTAKPHLARAYGVKDVRPEEVYAGMPDTLGQAQALMQQPAPDYQRLGYASPDFFKQPDNERQFEDFALGQITRLGSHAPKAVVAQWGQIQQRKQERIDKAAQFNENMIMQRHMADLRLRNNAFGEEQANYRTVMGQLAANRRQTANMKTNVSLANANTMNTLAVEQRKAMAAAMGGGPKPLMKTKDQKILQEQAVKPFIAAGERVHLARAYDYAIRRAAIEMGVVQGMGALNKPLQEIMRAFAVRGSGYMTQLRNQLRLEKLMEAAEKLGVRGTDTPQEQHRIFLSIMDSASNWQDVHKGLQGMVQKDMRALDDHAATADQMTRGTALEGYGQWLLEKNRDLIDLTLLSTAGRRYDGATAEELQNAADTGRSHVLGIGTRYEMF